MYTFTVCKKNKKRLRPVQFVLGNYIKIDQKPSIVEVYYWNHSITVFRNDSNWCLAETQSCNHYIH